MGSIEESKKEADARRIAFNARLAVLQNDVAKDLKMLELYGKGVENVRAILQWMEARHKEEQAIKGAELVQKHAAKHWKFLHLERLEKAADAVRAVLTEVKKGDPKLESIKILVVIGFNVSFIRDVSRLVKLAQVVRQAWVGEARRQQVSSA